MSRKDSTNKWRILFCLIIFVLIHCLIGLYCAFGNYYYTSFRLHKKNIRIENQAIEYITNLSNIPCKQCVKMIDANDMIHLFDTSIHECSSKFKHCGSSTPFLFSFGGSGNTVTRIIISDITNIYTGSIYPAAAHYAQLGSSGRFIGEGICGKKSKNNIVVIKAHPEHLNTTKLLSLFNGNCTINDCVCGIQQGDKYVPNHILYQKNHEWNKITFKFNGIIIVRNPWNAMWALYQLKFGFGCGYYRDYFVHIKHIYSKSTPECEIPMENIWNDQHFSKQLIDGLISYKEWLKTFELMKLMDEYNLKYIVVTVIFLHMIIITHCRFHNLDVY
eukprot:165114_1